MTAEHQVAANVRAIRRALDLTLEDVASRLGMSPKTLSKLELGQRRITVDDLVALAGALSVRPERLLDPVVVSIH